VAKKKTFKAKVMVMVDKDDWEKSPTNEMISVPTRLKVKLITTYQRVRLTGDSKEFLSV